MKWLKLSLYWFCRINSFWLAPLIATVACVLLIGESFVSDAFSDFCYRWPRMTWATFWIFWNEGAFYYCWQRESGGLNDARWFYRRPKSSRWVRADHWWIWGN